MKCLEIKRHPPFPPILSFPSAKTFAREMEVSGQRQGENPARQKLVLRIRFYDTPINNNGCIVDRRLQYCDRQKNPNKRWT